MKKSIANQLQLDVTGLRSDGISPSWDSDAENRVVNVFEVHLFLEFRQK